MTAKLNYVFSIFIATVLLGCAAPNNNKLSDNNLQKPPHRKVLIDPLYFGWEYSQAVRVGDIIWVSGKTGHFGGVLAEGVEAQARLAFQKIEEILKKAGSSLDDVVEIVTYHTSMEDLPAFRRVKSEFITKNFPAWTAIGVKELVFSGLLVEIKVTAVVGSGGSNN